MNAIKATSRRNTLYVLQVMEDTSIGGWLEGGKGGGSCHLLKGLGWDKSPSGELSRSFSPLYPLEASPMVRFRCFH